MFHAIIEVLVLLESQGLQADITVYLSESTAEKQNRCGPDCVSSGVHDTSMYHWLELALWFKLDLVNPKGDIVTISNILS